jgi:hypothetical protein
MLTLLPPLEEGGNIPFILRSVSSLKFPVHLIVTVVDINANTHFPSTPFSIPDGSGVKSGMTDMELSGNH